jgi:hypothetical protein
MAKSLGSSSPRRAMTDSFLADVLARKTSQVCEHQNELSLLNLLLRHVPVVVKSFIRA